eukprot:COSAG01_NODE_1173_length_11400_cov_2.767366_9_plen_72_part_00
MWGTGTPKAPVETKANFPDWVLWNVGAEKAPLMKDLGENEYSHFVCIEPTVASAVVVVPCTRRHVGGVPRG